MGVIARSLNCILYGDMSRRVMRVLARFSPEVEVYSIDECFLDLTGFESRLEPHASSVRSTVLQETGIPVSVGIAPSKTLAKAAKRLAKKGVGVCVVGDEAQARAALGRLELTDLWGVAERLARRLETLGIASPLALRDADIAIIRKELGVVGERLVRELRGEPCLPLALAPSHPKSIVCSRSFGREVTERAEMDTALATFLERAAAKLRRSGSAAGAVQVFIMTNRFTPQVPPYAAAQAVELPVASAQTSRLLAASLKGLSVIWKAGIAYKKAGVMLLDIVPADAVQGDLFGTGDSPRHARLMATLDRFNALHGRGTLTTAVARAKQQRWGLRSDMRSPCTTTRWDELLKVA